MCRLPPPRWPREPCVGRADSLGLLWKNLPACASAAARRAEAGVQPADGGARALPSADGASLPCPCSTHPGDDPLREPNISNLSLPLFDVGLPCALGANTSNRGAVQGAEHQAALPQPLAFSSQAAGRGKRSLQARGAARGDARAPQGTQRSGSIAEAARDTAECYASKCTTIKLFILMLIQKKKMNIDLFFISIHYLLQPNSIFRNPRVISKSGEI